MTELVQLIGKVAGHSGGAASLSAQKSKDECITIDTGVSIYMYVLQVESLIRSP